MSSTAVIIIILLILISLISLTSHKENVVVIPRRYLQRRFIPITVTVPLQLPILIGVWQVLQNDSFAGYIKVDRIPSSPDEYQSYHYDITMMDIGKPWFRFRVLDHTNISVIDPSNKIGNFTATVVSRDPLTFGGLSYKFIFARIT